MPTGIDPDFEYFIRSSGSGDSMTLGVFSCRTGALLQRIPIVNTTKVPELVSVSPDGQQLMAFFSLGNDFARVWNTSTWETTIRLRALDRRVLDATIDAAGRNIYIGGFMEAWNSSGQGPLLEVHSMSPPHEMRAFLEPEDRHSRLERIHRIALDSSGHKLVAGTDYGDILFWDTRSRQRIRTLHAHEGGVLDLKFIGRDRERLLSVGSDSILKIWNPDRRVGDLPARKNESGFLDITLHEGNRWLLCCHEDNGICFLPLENSGSAKKSVLPLASDSKSPLDYVFLGTGGDRVAYSTRNGALYISSLDPNSSPIAPQIEATFHTSSARLRTAVFSKQDLLFVASYRDNSLPIFTRKATENGSIWTERHRFKTAHSYNFIEFSQDRNCMALASRAGPQTFVWNIEGDVAGWGQQYRVDCGGHVRQLTISADSHYLACSTREGMVGIWNLKSGEKIFAFKAHDEEIGALRFTPGDDRLVTGSHDGSIKFWNLTFVHNEPAALELATLTDHSYPIRCIRFDRAGQNLITVGGNEEFSEFCQWGAESRE